MSENGFLTAVINHSSEISFILEEMFYHNTSRMQFTIFLEYRNQQRNVLLNYVLHYYFPYYECPGLFWIKQRHSILGNISFLHVVIVSSKWKFFRGIVITFPAVFYIFLGIFSARMHKISHEAKPSEKFYAWRLRKCQEKCRKQLEKCWQFQGKIGTCETALPHVRILFSVIHASIPKKKFWIFKRIS